MVVLIRGYEFKLYVNENKKLTLEDIKLDGEEITTVPYHIVLQFISATKLPYKLETNQKKKLRKTPKRITISTRR